VPKFKHSKLVKMHQDGKRADDTLFSEQRTNVLLKMGDHYRKKSSQVYNELRSRGVINKKQKLRLTQNHVHRITNVYENAILEGNPSAIAAPYNEDELHDVKTAEMNNSVLGWVRQTNDWEDAKAKNVGDFITIGEVFGKVRFDYDLGPVVGVDKEGKPAKLGEFVIDRIFAFDMKRDPDARSEKENRWWIHEQMMNIDEYKDLIAEFKPAEVKNVSTAGKGTMKIFDSNTGEYRDSKNQVMVYELFHKPSPKFPKGWYAMFSEHFTVVEGPLPFGIYPIVAQGFDEMTTSPRSSSIVRVCRPYQVEINRSSSKIAEHQITLGDDKVYIQKGTKLSNGGYLHGVRAFQVSGQQPIIQEGRNGSQYLDYKLSQVSEMYQAVDLAFILEEKQQVGDPFQLLFRAMKEKKRFVKYAEKYQRFEINIAKVVLKMAKKYLTENHIIKIAGRSEAVNIPEFKKAGEEGFEIKIVPQSGDVESQFGKILATTQTLQYAGGQMSPDQIGKLIKNLPFGNEKQIFSTLTVDDDNAVNDQLALDRGEEVAVNLYDNHEFMIKALTHRKKRSDFKFLALEIQQAYDAKLEEHELVFHKQKQAAQQAQLGMIPMDGFLTTVNTSWFNPASNRVERVKIPSGAISWLMQKMNEQGQFVKEVENLPLEAQANIGQSSQNQNDQPQADNVLQIGPQAQN